MALFVVTGGAGFIGSHLVAALVSRGDRVRVLDDLSSGVISNLPCEPGPPESGGPVELYQGDLLSPGLLRAAVVGARGIFHQAAQVSVPGSIQNPIESYRVNVTGTLWVLEAARAEKAKVVFAASSAAYGDDPKLPKSEEGLTRPLSPYASGKLAGEALLSVWGTTYGLETVALRYFNVYGPRQADNSPYSGAIALFAKAVLSRTGPTIFGDGEQTRDFVFVEDVVRANLAAMDRTLPPGALLNVGSGRATTINEVYRRLGSLAGFAAAPRYVLRRPGDVLHSLASIERARESLGYQPSVSLDEGLSRTLDWYRRRRPLGPE